MSRMPRIMGTASMVVGVLAMVVGVAVYLLVRSELSDQKITVSSDAQYLAGKDVTGPFTAYAEAQAINKHALAAGDGKTYAEIDKDDPARDTVMTADFLQASLFTSVVAFGVSALVFGLGVMFVLFGFVFRELDRRTRSATGPQDEPADGDAATETETAAAPAAT